MVLDCKSDAKKEALQLLQEILSRELLWGRINNKDQSLPAAQMSSLL